MMQEGVIIGIIKTKQSYQAERSVERKASWIARFCSDILKIDKRNRLVRGQNVPCHSKCFQTTIILKYSYLQTIQKPRKQEQSDAKHNRFLFWICQVQFVQCDCLSLFYENEQHFEETEYTDLSVYRNYSVYSAANYGFKE